MTTIKKKPIERYNISAPCRNGCGLCYASPVRKNAPMRVPVKCKGVDVDTDGTQSRGEKIDAEEWPGFNGSVGFLCTSAEGGGVANKILAAIALTNL